MRGWLPLSAVASLFAAGCGSGSPSTDASSVTDAARVIDSATDAPDAWQPPDARPLPDLCDSPPVADPITISGQAGPVAGDDHVVELRDRLDSALVASTAPDANGDFSFTIVTNGAPLDVYVAARKPGFVTQNWVPAEPFRESTSEVDIYLGMADDHAELALLAGTSRDPALGDMLVLVFDCSGIGVAGATVSTVPSAGTLVYGDEQGLPNPLLPSTFNGSAFAFNVPVESVQVSATTAVPFAAHDVPSFAGEVTITFIHP